MPLTIWQHLRLSPASLEALNELAPLAHGEGAPRKPQTIAFVGTNVRREMRIETVKDWHAQDPISRIVNAILVSAVRQRAQIVTFEPTQSGARVRLTLAGQERDHISLPSVAARPVLSRFKAMAAINGEVGVSRHGTIRLQIDACVFDLQLWSEPTAWGERLELRLPEL